MYSNIRPIFSIIAFILVFIVTNSCVSAPEEQTDDTVMNVEKAITVFIAPFSGADYQIATGISLALGYQLQHVYAVNTSQKIPYGYDTQYLILPEEYLAKRYKDSVIARESHIHKIARDYEGPALLIVWGEVFQYGGDFVIQSLLSIPEISSPKSRELSVWNIRLNNDNNLTFRVGLPLRRLEFAPIVVSKDIIAEYSGRMVFPIYKDENRTAIVGTVRWGDFSILGVSHQTLDGMLQIETPKGLTGWIKIPLVSDDRIQLIDTVEGVKSALTGDWKRAAASLRRIIEDEKASTTIKYVSYLYTAFAKGKANINPSMELNEALRINPYSDRAASYLMMSYLAELERFLKEEKGQEELIGVLDSLERSLEKYSGVFSENDPWLIDLKKKMPEIKKLVASGA